MKLFLAFFCLFWIGNKKIYGQASTTNDASLVDIYSLQSCDQLFNSAKSPAEKVEMQKDYWTLLGIISDLANYRQSFLKAGKCIDLFPTAYYHVTLAELQYLVVNKFSYPIEQMKIMIAFYDAYKWNRRYWDGNNKGLVEDHWKVHFKFCEQERIKAIDYFCWETGFILSTAIQAHVKCDLPRAIRYAYSNRFTQSLKSNNSQYLNDFNLTNELFKESSAKTRQDVVDAKLCSDGVLRKGQQWADLPNGLYESDDNGITKYIRGLFVYFGLRQILLDNDVIALRLQAFQNAFSGLELKDFRGLNLLDQPKLNHTQLINTGKQICPPTDDPPPVQPSQPIAETPSTIAPPISKNIITGLLGAPTPEALGKLMLKAIKTNDKKLWASCVHPNTYQNREDIISSFNYVRQKLEEAGVTQWQSLEFSRVVFSINGPSGWAKPDGGEYQGEKVRRSFVVEFTYRNREFAGNIGNISIMTYKRGNYFMANFSKAFMNRL